MVLVNIKLKLKRHSKSCRQWRTDVGKLGEEECLGKYKESAELRWNALLKRNLGTEKREVEQDWKEIKQALKSNAGILGCRKGGTRAEWLSLKTRHIAEQRIGKE